MAFKGLFTLSWGGQGLHFFDQIEPKKWLFPETYFTIDDFSQKPIMQLKTIGEAKNGRN